MTWSVELTRAAVRDLRKLPREATERLNAAIAALRDDPRPAGCVKLTGLRDTWRIRVGDYRVIYEIHETAVRVLVVRVRHRRDVYR